MAWVVDAVLSALPGLLKIPILLLSLRDSGFQVFSSHNFAAARPSALEVFLVFSFFFSIGCYLYYLLQDNCISQVAVVNLSPVRRYM